MNRFRLPIFAGNLVEFHGFGACELAHMQELLEANGGKVANSPGERTHLVVDEYKVEALPASLEVNEGCHLVKGEWFWRSIQIDAAAKVDNHGWRNGQNVSRNIEVFSQSTQIGDQVKVQVSHLDYMPAVTAEKEKQEMHEADADVVEQCEEVVYMLIEQVVLVSCIHNSTLAQPQAKQSGGANRKALAEERELWVHLEQETKRTVMDTQVVTPAASEDNEVLVSIRCLFVADYFKLEDTPPEKIEVEALEETLGVFPIGCHDMLDFIFEDTPEQILQNQKDIIEKTPAFLSSLESASLGIQKEKAQIPEETECKIEDLCVILFCWFGIGLNALEAVAARFANRDLIPKLTRCRLV